jgi:hypothetical protein
MLEKVEYRYIEGLMHLLVSSFTLRKCTVQNVNLSAFTYLFLFICPTIQLNDLSKPQVMKY